MRHLSVLATISALFLLFSCEPPVKSTLTEKNYLFLGHTYDWLAENRIDPRLEFVDYSNFSGVWLGGDICARTTKDSLTLNYLDDLFQLKNENTHWAWGNHDLMEGDANLLRGATGRESYYTHYDDGLLLLVLNTNLYWHHPWNPPMEDCEAKTEHFNWLRGVLDTVQVASHLVVLHHHGLLNELKKQAEETVTLGNVDAIPVRPLCDSILSFTDEIHPQLIQLEERGIEVVLVSGDVGMRSKGYEFTTTEGITILGSGVNNSLDMEFIPEYVTNLEPDSVLTLQYTPHDRQLSWSFVRLNELVTANLKEGTDPSADSRIQRLFSKY